jgi:predicted transcriptional regulator of viral defense system
VGGKRQSQRDEGRPREWEWAVGQLASRQHGVVSNSQLRRLGLGREAVRRRVTSGYLHRVHHGIFAVGYPAITLHGRYMAAVLAGGPRAALSHRSAADLWDLRTGSTRVTITVPHPRRAVPAAVRVHRSRMLLPGDVTELHGIPVTTVARTLLDLAGVASARELARAVDAAERHDLFDLAAVDDVLARARGRRGAVALRDAIAAWRPRYTRSELEDRFAALVEKAGLPPPQLNVLLDGEHAQHEVDAFWPATWLVVELDSFAYHRTRRDRERDAARDADLELAGYRVVRLTWDEATMHAERTVRRLRRLTRGGR